MESFHDGRHSGSVLGGDNVVDDVYREFEELLKETSSPRTGLGVPEMAEEVAANKNMEQNVQTPPVPPPNPPQLTTTGVQGSLKWTKELHASFVNAVRHLGGAFSATPKTVRDIMNIEGLSLHQVKSHLQKYRTGKRLCNDWRQLYKRGSSFSRALAGPSKPATSSLTPRAKKRTAKHKKQDNGSLHMKIQFQKHLERLLEIRRYAHIAATRMAGNQFMGGSTFAGNQSMGGYSFAANQNRGGYPFAANQNSGGYLFAANQNIGGHGFAQNQNMGGCSSSGMKTYQENSFIREATMTPMQNSYPYQLNQYNGGTSAAAIHSGQFIAGKPDELQRIPAAYPHQQTQASFHVNAASGSYQQGFNSDADESSGLAGMSDEEFIASFLIDYDELAGDVDNQSSLT